jgi:uncharacterized protein YkwD
VNPRSRPGWFARFVLAIALAACEEPPHTPRAEPSDPWLSSSDDLPASVEQYTSAPEPGGPLGGPAADAFEARLLRALHDRGDPPVDDERLSRIARWMLRRAMHGSEGDRTLIDAVARRVGFPGPTPWILLFHGGDTDEDLKRKLATLPTNVPISRLGLAAASRGPEQLVAVGLGTVELTLAAVPKHMTRAQVGHLAGTLDRRFTSLRLSITRPDGEVKSWTKEGTDFGTDFQLPRKGVSRVELLGDGPSGPVVVANFPIYVEVDEPLPGAVASAPDAATETPRAPEGPVTAAWVEARILDLLNADRVAARRKPVAVDGKLADAARAHSEDMVAHAFFAHVSPTTGTTEDRLRRAHLLFGHYGENLSHAGSAEEAHRGLMQSPAHREAMLDADFTHVGIGAVVDTGAEEGPRNVTVTLEFARERPLSVEEASDKIAESIAVARLTHGMSSVRMDDELRGAARAGAGVLAESLAATDRAKKVASEASHHLKGRRRWTCTSVVKTADVDHFHEAAALDPRVKQVGVASVPDPDQPETLVVVLVVEGVTCD